MAWKTRYGSLAVGFYRVLIDPLLWPLRPKVVRICRELEVGDVLDIATATGAQCRALDRAGTHVTGLDLSESMIAAAKRRGGKNADYVLGSAFELPFPDGSFDASLLLLALHEHTEAERSIMMSEAFRVIRPRGALIVADFTRPERSRFHLPWQVIRFIERTAGPEHNAGFNDFVTRGCLDGLLDRHGFTAVRRIRSHFGTIEIAVARR
jgi:ubiquinone/menaquinone biosynthesis C-methylase UbiE